MPAVTISARCAWRLAFITGDTNMSTGSLAGKTALVTGGSRNIGRAIALKLAGAGADVVVNTLSDRNAAEGVTREIQALGRKSLVQVADITDREAVSGMVREANAALGPIDILVCNASSRGQVDFLDLDYAAWRRVIDISLDGTFHCAQATLPGMIAKGWGRIITLGGISWHIGFKRRAHNLTGKSGLTGLTRALAVEFGDRGITANVIPSVAVATLRPASARVSGPRTGMLPVPRDARVARRLLPGPARAEDPGSANDVARFLAGLPPAADSPLAAFTREASWQQHARYFDNAWKGLHNRQLARIEDWSRQNLETRQPTTF